MESGPLRSVRVRRAGTNSFFPLEVAMRSLWCDDLAIVMGFTYFIVFILLNVFVL
jgi:hypothetical protein